MSAGKQVYTFESEQESSLVKSGALTINLHHFVDQLLKGSKVA